MNGPTGLGKTPFIELDHNPSYALNYIRRNYRNDYKHLKDNLEEKKLRLNILKNQVYVKNLIKENTPDPSIFSKLSNQIEKKLNKINKLETKVRRASEFLHLPWPHQSADELEDISFENLTLLLPSNEPSIHNQFAPQPLSSQEDPILNPTTSIFAWEN